jgi:hypothetical protein
MEVKEKVERIQAKSENGSGQLMVGIIWWSISSAQGILKSLQQKPNLWTGINSPATVAKPSETGSKKRES